MNSYISRRGFLSVLAYLSNDLFANRASSQPETGFSFDGKTDNAPAINQALLDAVQHGNGVVMLPAGVSLVGETILMPSGSSLIGKAGLTVLLAKPSLNTHMLSNSHGDIGNVDIKVSGIVFDGNQAQQDIHSQARGLYFHNVSGLQIDSISVLYTNEHCCHISYSEEYEVTRHSNVRLCKFIGSGHGGQRSSSGLAMTNAQKVEVSGVVSLNHERAGFRLGTRGAVKLIDTLAENCGDGGYVPVSGSHGISFLRAIASRNGRTNRYQGFRFVGISDLELVGCISTENDGEGIIFYNGCEKVVVSGGLLSDNGQSTSSAPSVESQAGVTISSTGRPNNDIMIKQVLFANSRGLQGQSTAIRIDDIQAKNVEVEGCFYSNIPNAIEDRRLQK